MYSFLIRINLACPTIIHIPLNPKGYSTNFQKLQNICIYSLYFNYLHYLLRTIIYISVDKRNLKYSKHSYCPKLSSFKLQAAQKFKSARSTFELLGSFEPLEKIRATRFYRAARFLRVLDSARSELQATRIFEYSNSLNWYAEFKRGRTSTDDAERSGRPKSAVVPENIKNVHKIVLKDRKMKLREIADTLKISEGSVFTTLHEKLGMHKLLSKWVPRLLTPDQKQQRVDDSERCLELFKRNKKDFLRRYVTMDETWIHHYTPESKRSSAEWTDSSR